MLTIIVILAGYWLLTSLLAFYNVRKIIRYFNNLPKIYHKEEWKGFIRSDLGKWNERQILIGCFTRFPYHLTVLGFFLISFVVLIPLSKFFGQWGKQIVTKLQRKYGNFAIRLVYNIVEQQDYQHYKIKTPLVISNHVNWFDVWYIGIMFMPISILSKASIKKTPIVGTIADFFDTIYVQRTSGNHTQRESVVQKITQRIQQFNKNKDKKPSERTNPLIIFPEGTTSNGRCILNFKHGPFNDLQPITMFALNYKCKQFQMGMGDISQAQHVFISLCLKPTLQVKHKVMHPQVGETVDDYCKRCRHQLSLLTGFPQVESRFRDYLEYQKTMNEAMKEQQKTIKVLKKNH